VRCVILDDYQGVSTAYADWSAVPDLSVEVVRDHLTDVESVVSALAGATIVVVMRERTPLGAKLLARLPDLRLVVTTGMRNASIDLEACRQHGVTVCGTGSLTTPTVELTWALIHGLTRNLLPEAQALRADRWQSTVSTDLAGSTLGLLGLGKIGTRVAAVARAFEMDVAAWSPHLTEERAAEAGVRLVTKPELFSGSDVVSLHLVLSDSTRGVVGAAELGAMRPTAYLVNTSRAGLVDSEALLEAVDLHRIAGAGLDVFDEEPLPAGDRLRSHPRVLATPHLGYVTEGNYRTYFTEAVEDVAAWLAGTPVRTLN
jgi:phosphoglycerate dehydrogenase-like enzyme